MTVPKAAVERVLQVCWFGSTLVPYSASLDLQAALAERIGRGLLPDTVLQLQHSPVYTIGKRGTADDLLRQVDGSASSPPLEADALRDVEVHSVPRGGQTTFHGQGQLVVYPIVALRRAGLGARAYVEALEDATVATAGAFGISARGRVPGRTGVWVGDRKLGAVGVRISHGVTTHGVAVNVSTDLRYFDGIVPCGQPDRKATSLAKELGLLLPPQPPLLATTAGAHCWPPLLALDRPRGNGDGAAAQEGEEDGEEGGMRRDWTHGLHRGGGDQGRVRGWDGEDTAACSGWASADGTDGADGGAGGGQLEMMEAARSAWLRHFCRLVGYRWGAVRVVQPQDLMRSVMGR